MRRHPSSRLRAISSWTVAGTLTLVLSTTAVALMSHASTGPSPLSESVVAPTTTSAPNSPAPATSAAPAGPSTLAPPVVTYTYRGDDGSSNVYGSPSGAYGDD